MELRENNILGGNNHMKNSSIRLDGQKILITGVSRPSGIGATLAKRFAEAGALVAVHGFSDYDMKVHKAKTAFAERHGSGGEKS
jgi:NAD(P)-dependent dehydrogenase (short-subunit alcohol dehydrogenase family)